MKILHVLENVICNMAAIFLSLNMLKKKMAWYNQVSWRQHTIANYVAIGNGDHKSHSEQLKDTSIYLEWI